VQALVASSYSANQRRATHGLENGRVSMVQAVVSSRVGLPLHSQDVFVSTVGGVRITEPAADLAIVLALSSAILQTAMPARTVVFGEVGLSGEVRPVSGVGRRLSEAARLGFRTAVVPHGAQTGPLPEGIKVLEVGQAAEAVRRLLVEKG